MSQLVRDYVPALKYGAKILSSEVIGEVGNDDFATVRWVDGDNGSDSNNGESPSAAFKTIQAAVTASSREDIIKVRPLAIATGATDPSSYTENIVIPADKDGLKIVGIGTGRVQGGLPQVKVGTTTTQAILTIRAPGCVIANLGFNGAGATGGGILLDDDGSTKTAFGTTIVGCHFKNCKGTTATNAATGGAIQWSAAGNAWQVLIRGNNFYKNVGDIVLKGTSGSVPQDVVVEDNVFSGPAASVDCNIYTGGSGINGLTVRDNVFPCFPAIGSGTNAKNLVLTGSVGILAGNRFGCTGKTFGAAGNNLVPTTMFLADNYQEDGTTQIART